MTPFDARGKHKPFENTVGKGEIDRNEQFLLFPQCFLPVRITFCHFCQIRNCRLQTLSVWKSLKFVVWLWVKETFKERDESWLSSTFILSLTLSQTINFKLFQTERSCRRQFQI